MPDKLPRLKPVGFTTIRKHLLLAIPAFLASCLGPTPNLAEQYLTAIQDRDLGQAKAMLCYPDGDLFFTQIEEYTLEEPVQAELQGFEAQVATATIDGEEYSLIVWDTEVFANFAIANKETAAAAGIKAPAPKAEDLPDSGQCITIN